MNTSTHQEYCCIDIGNVVSDRKEREKHIIDMFKQQTHKELKKQLFVYLHEHYRSYGFSHWNMFLDTFLPVTSKVFFSYNTQTSDINETNITGICMVIEGTWIEHDNNVPHTMGHPDDIYIRCLCSNCFCGGKLLRHVLSHYTNMITKSACRFNRFTLHAEPQKKVMDFYIRHGFTLMTNSLHGSDGLFYPLMIKNIHDKTSVIVRKNETIAKSCDKHVCLQSSIIKTIVNNIKSWQWYMSSMFGI